MKKLSKLLAVILAISLLVVPVSAKQETASASLTYRDISITIDGERIFPTDVSGKTVDPFIIDGTTYLPVRAVAEALGCEVAWDDATSTVAINSNAAETVSHTLKAGAGVGEIKWDASVITASNEGFSGEYLDIPHARVLLLEDEVRAAIVSLELVQPGNIVEDLQALISEELDVPVDNIWIHCTHRTTTLHIRGDEAAAAVLAGVKEACVEARATFQPAVMGVGAADLDINVNRNVPIPAGLDPDQWTGKNAYGFTGTEYSPKEMTILRFDSAESGEPIGFYMTYPMKPVGLDQSGKTNNERLITSDIPGYACTMVEDELGAPCLFFMPAAGDQVSKESATVPGYLEDGTWGQTDLGIEAGKAIIEKYGTLMGDAAIALAKGITADENDVDIKVASTTFSATGVNRGEQSPVEVPVSAIAIGDDVALVGFKPELDGITGSQLADASPYDTTLLVAFMNGDSKYMPHYEAWDYNGGKGTQEVIDGAAYVRGTAETLVEEAVKLLAEMKDNTPKTGTENVVLNYRDINLVVNGKAFVPTDVNGKVVEPFAIDGTTYLPVRAVAEALGCKAVWDDATGPIAISSNAAETVSHTLKAGAGVGEIKWDASVITASNEGFSGEYLDIPHARVLLLEDEVRAAIVSLELVQPGNIVEDLQALISEELDVPVDNIWIHCTHRTTTLHIRGDEAAAAVLAGVKEACVEARATFQPAVMGVGAADLDINVNRNVPIPAGLDPDQWTGKNAYGFTGTEYSPKEMTILRFDSAESGEPIGFYMTYPMKPVGLDQSGKTNNERLITSDIPGYACTMVEDELGAPCLFFMPAAGDQVSKESATVPGYLEDGTWGQTDLGIEAGKAIIEKYGTLMGDAAIALAKGITADENDVDIKVASTTFSATGVNRGEQSPVEVPVSAIAIGDDVALVGFKPELDGITGSQLADASPYDTTLLVAFMNGDSKYMPHYEAWDYNGGKGTQEVIDGAAYVRGTAETLVEEAVKLLNGMASSNGGSGLQSIQTIGYMAPDGAKLQTIVLEYGEAVSASSVSLSDYEISTYGTVSNPKCDLGSDPGKPVNIYVNNVPAASTAGGVGIGKYVIIEVNTDYQLTSMPNYKTAMMAGVKQVGTVNTASGSPIPAGGEVSNYTVTESTGRNGQVQYSYNVDADTISLPDVEVFEIHDYSADTPAPLHVTNCYSEQTGNYNDADLMYAIYVPEGYTDDGNYALAMVIPDSTGMSDDDVMVSLTTTQHAVNLASEQGQNNAKAAGLDGVIVLVPQFTSSLNRENSDLSPLSKGTYDNMTFGSSVPAAWQLLDYITSKYSGINMDRIYGLGESGGGMTILCMAPQRDNYFAGLWIQGAQWGNIYNTEANSAFSKTYPAPVDGTIITNENYRNWYYSLSDDNILLTTCEGDGNATPHASELTNLYKDIAGIATPQSLVDPLGDSVESQNAALTALTAKESKSGLYWLLMKDGSHMQTFIYGPRLNAGYEWLLQQTKSSEDARQKQENLNREWAAETDEAKLAAAQTADRILYTDAAGTAVYCAVPAQGAGTIGYTSPASNRGSVLPVASTPVYDGSGNYAQ